MQRRKNPKTPKKVDWKSILQIVKAVILLIVEILKKL